MAAPTCSTARHVYIEARVVLGGWKVCVGVGVRGPEERGLGWALHIVRLHMPVSVYSPRMWGVSGAVELKVGTQSVGQLHGDGSKQALLGTS